MLRAWEVFQPFYSRIAGRATKAFRIRDPEELDSRMSLAFAEAYEKYNPKRSANLEQYLCCKVWMLITGYYRKDARREKILKRVKDIPDVADRKDPNEFSIKKFSVRLDRPSRKDVRFVLTILFDGEFLSMPSPTKCRVMLARFIRSEFGWSRVRVDKTFSKIREALRKGD